MVGRFLAGYPEIKHKYFPVLLGMGNEEMRNSPRLKVISSSKGPEGESFKTKH